MVGIAAAKCILVLGATSGIGRALALALHNLPSKPTVIVAGRRQERLDELKTQGERFQSIRVDINTDRETLKAFVQEVITQYPDLDAVLFSSGIQHIFKFKEPEKIDLDLLQDEFNTNYVAITTLIVFFLPHFLKLSHQDRHSFIIPVTSGLGIVPGSWVPNYSATKAAVHSLALSLAAQLRDTNVHVLEIIPPLVESELHDHQGTTPQLKNVWMSLDDFTKATIEGLERGDLHIGVGGAAEVVNTFGEQGKVDRVFKGTPLLSHKAQ